MYVCLTDCQRHVEGNKTLNITTSTVRNVYANYFKHLIKNTGFIRSVDFEDEGQQQKNNFRFRRFKDIKEQTGSL